MVTVQTAGRYKADILPKAGFVCMVTAVLCCVALPSRAQGTEPYAATVEMPSVNVMTLSQAIEFAREKH